MRGATAQLGALAIFASATLFLAGTSTMRRIELTGTQFKDTAASNYVHLSDNKYVCLHAVHVMQLVPAARKRVGTACIGGMAARLHQSLFDQRSVALTDVHFVCVIMCVCVCV